MVNNDRQPTSHKGCRRFHKSPRKIVEGLDEWRAGNIFGWKCLIDEFENFGKDSDNKINWQTDMERSLGMDENVEQGDVQYNKLITIK